MLKIIVKHGVGKLKCRINRFETVQVRHNCHLMQKRTQNQPKIVFSGGLGGSYATMPKNRQKVKILPFSNSHGMETVPDAENNRQARRWKAEVPY